VPPRRSRRWLRGPPGAPACAASPAGPMRPSLEVPALQIAVRPVLVGAPAALHRRDGQRLMQNDCRGSAVPGHAAPARRVGVRGTSTANGDTMSWRRRVRRLIVGAARCASSPARAHGLGADRIDEPRGRRRCPTGRRSLKSKRLREQAAPSRPRLQAWMPVSRPIIGAGPGFRIVSTGLARQITLARGSRRRRHSWPPGTCCRATPCTRCGVQSGDDGIMESPNASTTLMGCWG
jgi:hypothetical protein